MASEAEHVRMRAAQDIFLELLWIVVCIIAELWRCGEGILEGLCYSVANIREEWRTLTAEGTPAGRGKE